MPVAPAPQPPSNWPSIHSTRPETDQLKPVLGRPTPSPVVALFVEVDVQSLQVAVALNNVPCPLEPVSVWWLSSSGACGLGRWLPMPNSLGRSSLIAASASGRVFNSPAMFIATSRPVRSYQGPVPMRSLAFTLVVLKNACHCLAPEPGMEDSAISVQILSAPVRPSAVP